MRTNLKSHAYNVAEWEAEQARLRIARKKKTGTINRQQTRLIDNTTEMLRNENEPSN